MKQIGISELQADVGAWIRQSVLEQEIVITEQGQPVAALISLPPAQAAKQLPNREERISRRSCLAVDSATYISEMRD